MTNQKSAGVYATYFGLSPLKELTNDLVSWRLEKDIQAMTKYKKEGRVFEFVIGLRFSARLIYATRECFARNGKSHVIEVDWGQIVSDDGELLSPECDIIIHKPGYTEQWNGNKNPVMDFKFIKRSKVLVVVSCKSFLARIDEKNKEYCERVRKYLNEEQLIWLFAECVPIGKKEKYTEKAKDYGYDEFWYLYDWDNDNFEFDEQVPIMQEYINKLKVLINTE